MSKKKREPLAVELKPFVAPFSYDGVRKSSKSAYMALQPYWLGLLMNSRLSIASFSAWF